MACFYRWVSVISEQLKICIRALGRAKWAQLSMQYLTLLGLGAKAANIVLRVLLILLVVIGI